MPYTTPWNPANPTGAEAANTIDNIFRGLKVDLQERLIGLLGLANFTDDPLVFYTPPTAWTPVLGGSGGTTGQSYSNQTGLALKIGKLVIAGFSLTLSNKGTITTSAQIQGLPYACNGTLNQTGVVGLWVALNTAVINLLMNVPISTTVANLYMVTAASTNTTAVPMVTADITNTTRLDGTLIYLAA